MRQVFAILLIAGLASAAPTSKEDDEVVTITEDFFPDQLAIYTSKNDIVNIYVPINSLNIDDDDDDDNDAKEEEGVTLFFVEAKFNPSGRTVNKGLYVFRNGKAKKLLDHGRDITASSDDPKVFFGAEDGLYTYNIQDNKAEKYGTITDNIIGLAKENNTDVIYILTNEKLLYKVTDEGTKKVKIDEVANVEEFILDYSNNIYYYDTHKQVYVLNEDGVKKIEGLPENPSYAKLIRPAFVLEDSAPFIADNKAYMIYANGTVETPGFEFKVKPTAYSMEASLFQYYAYNKKIYEYNVLSLILGDLLNDLKNFLDDKKEEIQSIATRSRSELRA